MNLPPPSPEYKQRMPFHGEGTVFVSLGLDAFGRELLLTPEAGQAWSEMQEAAAAEGVQLVPISGFRSIQRQAEIVEKKLSSGVALEEILKVNAYPGYSEHHTGRAIDIGSPNSPHLEEEFERTWEFQWLSKKAANFGFYLSYPRDNPYGIIYEPWHWCWRPESLK